MGEEVFSETLSFASGHGVPASAGTSEQNWRIKFPRWENFMFSEKTSEPIFYLEITSIFSPSGKNTIAFLNPGLNPSCLPTRRFFPETLIILTRHTLTPYKSWIIFFISFLVAEDATSKIYWFWLELKLKDFSVTKGWRKIL